MQQHRPFQCYSPDMAELAEPREITPVRFFSGVESPFVADNTRDLRPQVTKVATVNPGEVAPEDPTGFVQTADENEAEQFVGQSPDMPTTTGGSKAAAKD